MNSKSMRADYTLKMRHVFCTCKLHKAFSTIQLLLITTGNFFFYIKTTQLNHLA